MSSYETLLLHSDHLQRGCLPVVLLCGSLQHCKHYTVPKKIFVILFLLKCKQMAYVYEFQCDSDHVHL